jgi:phage baseplate assembly protein W
VAASSPERAFLGTGWSFPPTFSRPARSVIMASAELDIRQSLWVLFSTALGERVMLPQYGSAIWEMVFQAINTTLSTQIADLVQQAILYWEPRIDVEYVRVAPASGLDGVLLIEVSYLVRGTNTRNNLVYPFYIQEGTLASALP